MSAPSLDRRSFLRATGIGTAGLLLPSSWLYGCGGGSGGAAREQAVPLTVDPSVAWWLQNNFDPVFDEIDAFDLAVRGRIPPELRGVYVRNGSNPQSGESTHWFLGDGMLHGIRLEGGRAQWYRNRYVRTPLYEQGIDYRDGVLPTGGNNQSNVSPVYHAGRLLTSGEVGAPYEIDPADLSTVGVFTFADRLNTSFTAHSKIDPATGWLHFFGYWILPPYLTYHVADQTGAVVHSEEIAVGQSTMIHSFAITDRDVIFWELPVLLDLELAIGGTTFPFRWDASYGARIGVMPLGGPASAIRWVEIDPCYVFHELNAFRDGDRIAIDVCRYPYMMKDERFGDLPLDLRRWTIDTAGDALAFSEQVIEDRRLEFPHHDRRFTGRSNRHGWFVEAREHPGTLDQGGIFHLDHRSGRLRHWDAGPNDHAGEPFFVPGGAGEGDGWILSLVYDHAGDTSRLVVLEALDIQSGPVAEIALPRRVPFGFHGAWVPD